MRESAAIYPESYSGRVIRGVGGWVEGNKVMIRHMEGMSRWLLAL